MKDLSTNVVVVFFILFHDAYLYQNDVVKINKYHTRFKDK
jgi:hypothetical protein